MKGQNPMFDDLNHLKGLRLSGVLGETKPANRKPAGLTAGDIEDFLVSHWPSLGNQETYFRFLRRALGQEPGAGEDIIVRLAARAGSPFGTLLGLGLLQGLTGNIQQAEKGRTEEAKLLGYLMGLAPELPEELRSQIPTAAERPSRVSDVMTGFRRLSQTPALDKRRLSEFTLPSEQEEKQRFRQSIGFP